MGPIKLDWVRARQVASLKLGDYPMATVSDADIQKAATLEVRKTDKLTLAAVATRSAVEAAFESCNPALKADYCDIRFVNVTGALTVSSRLDRGNNQCKQASLDLASGELVSCIDTPCAAM